MNRNDNASGSEIKSRVLAMEQRPADMTSTLATQRAVQSADVMY
jgi:hypothetical protein